jgi:hypothetical protein
MMEDIRRDRNRAGSRRVARVALALISLLPLAACGGGTLAQDPFGDAAAECGDDHGAWRPGCATKRNIAALAEHPGDLDTPRGEGPRDSMRRDALISGYARSSAGAEPRAPAQPAPASGGRKEP